MLAAPPTGAVSIRDGARVRQITRSHMRYKCELATCLEIHPWHDIACGLGQTKVERELGGLNTPTVNRQSPGGYDANRIGDRSWYYCAGQALNPSRLLQTSEPSRMVLLPCPLKAKQPHQTHGLNSQERFQLVRVVMRS